MGLDPSTGMSTTAAMTMTMATTTTAAAMTIVVAATTIAITTTTERQPVQAALDRRAFPARAFQRRLRPAPALIVPVLAWCLPKMR